VRRASGRTRQPLNRDRNCRAVRLLVIRTARLLFGELPSSSLGRPSEFRRSLAPSDSFLPELHSAQL
jgi:hypothetical protein